MTIEGVDFSWARPTGAQVRAAGKRFVVRYVPYPGDGGKGLTKAEVADYHANGLGIVVVFESTAGRFLGDFAAGQSDARTSLAGLAPLGFPADRPIYFACDRDTNSTQYPLIDRYFDGVASVIGRALTGAYAEADLIDHLARADKARWHWQTYAWSGGRLSPESELYQYLNGQTLSGQGVDLDRALKPDYGAWWSGGVSQMYPVVTRVALAAPNPRLWRVAAGTTLAGYDVTKPGQALRTAAFATASSAHATHEVTVDWFNADGSAASGPTPRGGPFLVVNDGTYAGLLIVKALVTLDPADPVVPKADLDAAEASLETATALAAAAQQAAIAAQEAQQDAEAARVSAEQDLADWEAYRDAALKVGL